MIRLGVNIDHVATIRQARDERYPDPVQAAMMAVQAGADGITLHLREDRRHIQDRDVRLLKEILQVPMNLEMAATPEMIAIAEKIQPAHCCLVPEKRAELTTEGGLDVIAQRKQIQEACNRLAAADVQVSLFIDANENQIEAVKACEASVIEIHTGHYANAASDADRMHQWERISQAAYFANKLELIVNAGHGLHYQNVQSIAAIPVINELNIGHSIIAHSIFVGLDTAVKEMKAIMQQARLNALLCAS